MMKKVFFICTLLTAFNFLTAQEVFPGSEPCGLFISEDYEKPSNEELNHCFNVEEVFANCTKLWLRVNIHFFLNDDCSGSLDPLGERDIPIEDAYAVAEQYINDANAQLENNFAQWAQDYWLAPELVDDTPQCVPIRYVLSGVYVHCNTTARGTSGSSLRYFQNNFGVNRSTEFNVYLVNYHGSSNGAAYLDGTYFTSENFTAANFNHEMGHVLNLKHSFEDDEVEDSPPIRFKYDYNCDGDLLDIYPKVGYEGDWRQCWSILERGGIDLNNDGVDDIEEPCKREEPCEPYPCCSWAYQNNNIMAYASWKECCGAFTKGQIIRMLENLSTETKCNFIEDIGGDCPPPMANIGLLPTEAGEDDCKFCFNLEASMHEDHYKIEIINPATDVIMQSTGWQAGKPQNYCISNRLIKGSPWYNHGFVVGGEYIIRLTVENYCGDEAVEELKFILPDVGCTPDEPGGSIFMMKQFGPNPFMDAFDLEYEVMEKGLLDIRLQNTLVREYNKAVVPVAEVMPGVYRSQVKTAGLPSGQYALVIRMNDEIQSINLIKQQP